MNSFSCLKQLGLLKNRFEGMLRGQALYKIDPVVYAADVCAVCALGGAICPLKRSFAAVGPVVQR